MDKSTFLLKKAYYAFNKREIDDALATMHPDVVWANGMEGGYARGHDEVRSYWLKQWGIINPDIEPVSITVNDNGHIIADVRHVIRDLKENLISDEIVQHVYQIEEGLIRNMEIQKHPVTTIMPS